LTFWPHRRTRAVKLKRSIYSRHLKQQFLYCQKSRTGKVDMSETRSPSVVVISSYVLNLKIVPRIMYAGQSSQSLVTLDKTYLLLNKCNGERKICCVNSGQRSNQTLSINGS
jgi:hypothetical protein